MKIQIVLTAHGTDSRFTVATIQGAANIIMAFHHAIGSRQDHGFNANSLRERRVLKRDYITENAEWFAEIIG